MPAHIKEWMLFKGQEKSCALALAFAFGSHAFLSPCQKMLPHNEGLRMQQKVEFPFRDTEYSLRAVVPLSVSPNAK